MKIKLNSGKCCGKKENKKGCCHHNEDEVTNNKCCHNHDEGHQCCHNHQEKHQCCHDEDNNHGCCHEHGECTGGKEKNKGHGKNHLNCKAKIKVAGLEDELFNEVVSKVRSIVGEKEKIGYVLEEDVLVKYDLSKLPALLIKEEKVWDIDQGIDSIDEIIKNNL